MAWSRYPNTVTVYPVTQATTAGIVAISTVGSGTSRAVDFQLMTPGRAYEEYGVELRNPARVYAPAADIVHYPQGTRVTFDSETYEVVNSMVRQDGTGLYMSYTLAIMDKVI
jgi:hypothetical protein